eukprot:scaffold6998_cov57-Attheya_sp.AAC.1
MGVFTKMGYKIHYMTNKSAQKKSPNVPLIMITSGGWLCNRNCINNHVAAPSRGVSDTMRQ